MSQPFVIFANQRSGSHLLYSMLRTHPRLRCYWELLLDLGWNANEWNIYRYRLQQIQKDPSRIVFRKQQEDYRNFFTMVFSSAPECEAVGFNIKYTQIQEVPGVMEMLQAERVKAIHLVRRNVLAAYLSMQVNRLSEQRKLGRELHSFEKLPPLVVRLQADDDLLQTLRWRIAQIERYRSLLAQMFPCLEVSYESLLPAAGEDCRELPEGVRHGICDFLGVSDRDLPLCTRQVKVNPHSIRDYLENYDEVAEFLRVNGLEAYLE